MDQVQQQFDSTVRGVLPLDNEYVSAALSLFLIIYSGMVAPKLPERVARLFGQTWFRVLVFFLIAYTSRKNPTVAIIAAVGLLVSLQTLQKYDTQRKMQNIVENEEMVVAEENARIEASMAQATHAVGPAPQEGGIQDMLGGLMTGFGGPSVPEGMAEESMPGELESIPEGALAELQEGPAPVPGNSASDNVSNGSCSTRANFRNNFYPQYVASSEQHVVRKAQNSVTGFDALGGGYSAV